MDFVPTAEDCLMRYRSVYCGGNSLTFRRKVLHLQEQRIRQDSNRHGASIPSSCWLYLLCDSENGGTLFLPSRRYICTRGHKLVFFRVISVRFPNSGFKIDFSSKYIAAVLRYWNLGTYTWKENKWRCNKGTYDGCRLLQTIFVFFVALHFKKIVFHYLLFSVTTAGVVTSLRAPYDHSCQVTLALRLLVKVFYHNYWQFLCCSLIHHVLLQNINLCGEIAEELQH